MKTVASVVTSILLFQLSAIAAESDTAFKPFSGTIQWTAGAPLVAAKAVDGVNWHAIKDPSVVQYGGKWHLFCTVRGDTRSHGVAYLSFADWNEADRAEQTILPCHPGFFCAPQVFYYSPQKQWYLICQASDESWDPKYQVAYTTTDNIADPESWAPLRPLGATKPANEKAGLDFWIICDAEKAHLFFTSLDGRMWRAETTLAAFPSGWSDAAVALKGDIFEASHTYKIKGLDKYVTLIEAQGGHGWRYFKSYVADRLDGDWMPLAAEKDLAFASMRNVRQTGERWTDCISHGELIRAGYDERLEVEPATLRFLFQGVTDAARKGKGYGEIPWRLGILGPTQ